MSWHLSLNFPCFRAGFLLWIIFEPSLLNSPINLARSVDWSDMDTTTELSRLLWGRVLRRDWFGIFCPLSHGLSGCVSSLRWFWFGSSWDVGIFWFASSRFWFEFWFVPLVSVSSPKSFMVLVCSWFVSFILVFLGTSMYFLLDLAGFSSPSFTFGFLFSPPRNNPGRRWKPRGGEKRENQMWN